MTSEIGVAEVVVSQLRRYGSVVPQLLRVNCVVDAERCLVSVNKVNEATVDPTIGFETMNHYPGNRFQSDDGNSSLLTVEFQFSFFLVFARTSP